MACHDRRDEDRSPEDHVVSRVPFSRVRVPTAVRAVAAAGIAILVAVGCTGDDSSGGAGGEDQETVAITDVGVEANPNNEISAVLTFTTDEPSTGTVTLTSDDHTVEVPVEEATSHVVPLVGMRAERTYDIAIAAEAGGATGSVEGAAEFATGPLPDYLPPFEVLERDPERMAEGVTLMSLQNRGAGFPEEGVEPDEYPEDAPGGHIVAIDDEGEVVWYFSAPHGISDVDVNAAGNILAIYNQQGALEIDLLGNVVRSWSGTTTVGETENGQPRAFPGSVEVATDTMHHEISELPNGNLLTLSTELVDLALDTNPCPVDPSEPADPDAPPPVDFQGTYPVIVDTVVEFTPDRGEVVSERSLLDVLDPQEQPGHVFCETVPFDWYPHQPAASDWTHSNAVFLDADRNELIVSARHLNSVLALRYEDGDEGTAGELAWQLGPDLDFTLEGQPSGDSEWQWFQHSPSIDGEDQYLVYDNGNLRPGTTEGDGDEPPYSRAVVYEIDREAGTATQVWEHIATDVAGDTVYADFVGDADRLDNDNVLIDHGGIIIEDTAPDPETGEEMPIVRVRAHLFEVAPDGASGGDTVYEVLIEDPRIGWFVYRAERARSLYDIKPGG